MKRVCAAILCAILVLGSVSLGDEPREEVIIDVVEGRFLYEEYDLLLSEELERPIELGFINGHALVRVTLGDGDVMEIDLGDKPVALTQQAAPYVMEMRLRPEDYGEAGEPCPICGRSTMLGNHTLLPCGHYGCLKPADHFQVCVDCNGYVCNGKKHTICETCKVRWCVHVDLECAFTRNPTPSPYSTKTPSGVKNNHLPSTGEYHAGPPEGVDSSNWTPGNKYYQENMPEDAPGAGAGGAPTP